MRIIAGLYKGRKLISPPDQSVRPTPERVKEALFSILDEAACDAVVLDLFAGSGNLGLEALSRGAKKCVFGDNSKESIQVIRQNIQQCGAQQQSTVLMGDYRTVLSQITESLDLVFLDPPYRQELWEDAVSILAEKKLVNKDGVIVLEHPKDRDFPQEMYGFRKIKERRYGTVVLSIYMC